MSFISILKKVASVVIGVEHVAAPIAEVAMPEFAPYIAKVDGFVTRLQTAIATVETQKPLAGNGVLKAESVKADFEAGLAAALEALNIVGKKITYDDAALQQAIDAQVAAYNAMAAVKNSFKLQ